ncbi:hypothetical protein B0H14DRAFT_2586746 [Mycena olivaceomarginata]|nr:hypothetical protein B0H14DRAFT_2586746 [Mycena olivaceomarginata]
MSHPLNPPISSRFDFAWHISGKQSADDLEYISSPTIDLMVLGLGPGDLFHGIDSGMENHLAHWSGLWLSQEVPRLVPPLSTPPSVCTEPDQSITNKSAVNPQPEDDNIAPRDINLSFDERNIVTGKCRRTQSSRLTDPNAADSRPTKKGNNSWLMRVHEFNFLVATHAMATGIQLPFSS